MHSLLKSERPSSLAQTIIELGRINKTIYLLNCVDDEEYRRRILTQLNRGEARHAVARAIYHGMRQQGMDLKEEGAARLSPLSYKHVNMLGHYSFFLADFITQGKLRSLNKPEIEYKDA